MPTTSNFGWTTPADTDLVKDGALAIRTLGNGIDTSLMDLKGGTTGQILSKASNTDLDYTWINNDQGDITEVQAGTGISVASGTGPIPIVTNTVATAFDAKGDLIGGTGADTFSRLAVGTNGQVLTADSTTSTGLKWANSGKILQVISATYSTETDNSTSTYSDTGLTASITPSATSSKILVKITIPVMKTAENASNSVGLRLVRGVTTLTTWAEAGLKTDTAIRNTALFGINYVDSPSSTSALTYKLQFANPNNTARARICSGGDLATITLLEIGA